MIIYDILRQRRDIILKQWKNIALNQYSFGDFKIHKENNNRFGNPVAYTISSGLETILDEIIAETHTVKLDDALEEIVKIKSLQAEKPSIAVDFLFHLKNILKNDLDDFRQDGGYPGEIEKLHTDIDNLILSAFDIFMKCREKIYDIKSKEIMKRSYRLLERANMVDPAPRRKGDVDDEIGC
ncbi:MAG: RsbRD N-terminal domain-containing protein [Candidatus Zixiibacteriota bacterium]|nr:MAG: RsbRD N-terminal domain-containing protein [candidate division Zixibacteria bacterium]